MHTETKNLIKSLYAIPLSISLTCLVMFFALFISCETEDYSYYASKSEMVVLDKSLYPSRVGYFYKVYVYDGTTTYWCSTDEETYSSYFKGDTIKGIVITKTSNK